MRGLPGLVPARCGNTSSIHQRQCGLLSGGPGRWYGRDPLLLREVEVHSLPSLSSAVGGRRLWRWLPSCTPQGPQPQARRASSNSSSLPATLSSKFSRSPGFPGRLWLCGWLGVDYKVGRVESSQGLLDSTKASSSAAVLGGAGAVHSGLQTQAERALCSQTCQPHLNPAWGWKARPPRRHEGEPASPYRERPRKPALPSSLPYFLSDCAETSSFSLSSISIPLALSEDSSLLPCYSQRRLGKLAGWFAPAGCRWARPSG